jgi:hypothetical protein
LPDSQLLGAARAGDGAAFEQLVARYRAELLAHCYRLLGRTPRSEPSCTRWAPTEGARWSTPS